MRYWISIAVLAAAVGASAPAAADDNWTGFNVGLQTGVGSHNATFGASTDSVFQFTNPFITGRGIVVVPGTTASLSRSSHRKTAWEWGGQLGYAARFSPSVVGGLEGDIQRGGGVNGVTYTTVLPATAIEPQKTLTASRAIEARWLWSVRARLGYTADRWQLYATGGVAGGSLRVSSLDALTSAGGTAAPCAPPPCVGPTVITPYAVSNGGTSSANRTGWTAGAGAEWALSRSLSLGVEYRHTDLGSQNWTLRNAVITTQVPTVTAPAGSSSGGALPSAALADSQRISWSNDAVSVRLNYRFGH